MQNTSKESIQEVTRKTKRVKTHKPKPKLTTAEVQFLTTHLKESILRNMEKFHMDTAYAIVSRHSSNANLSDYHFRKAQKHWNLVQKLSKVQQKLKRGLA